MSKIIKVSIIFCILIFSITISNIYALSMDIDNVTSNTEDFNQVDVNTSVDNMNQTDTNTISNDDLLDISDQLTDDEQFTEDNDESLVPTINSNQSSLPESDLGLTNIINILLIVVGFVLILLGVAIMLRLKR